MNFFNAVGDALMNRLRDKWGASPLNHMLNPDQQQAPPPNFGQPSMGVPGADPTQAGYDVLGKGIEKAPYPMGDPMGGPVDAGASPERESMARQRGFRDYSQMLDWYRQRAQPHDVTVTRGSASPVPQAGQQGQGTDPMAIHPRNMFNNITAAIRGATGW